MLRSPLLGSRFGEIRGDMRRASASRVEIRGDQGRYEEMWGDLGSRCRGRADQPRQKVFEEHRRRVRQQHVVSRLATSEK